jgi:ABC-type transport system substrate-binding protein
MYIKALAAPSVADTKDLVIQGNKYMAAQHWVISVCNPNVFALYQPWLKGYNAQSFSISESGGSSGALWIGFYAARFWIDTNLKASMQH